mmetsp:Transcript_64487/g.192104  ORF Transcript_64487/g.192104 Transcript_64487/m.192104 type:complete len:256 (-) Transcript_64487:396-1163(-)
MAARRRESLATAHDTRSKTWRCAKGSAAQRRQTSSASGASAASPVAAAPGHCLTMTHSDSNVRCKSSSSASCNSEPNDVRTPCSTSSASFRGALSTAERKRQNARHAHTRTASGSPWRSAQEAACRSAGKSAGTSAHTASPSLRSSAKARARRNSGTARSAQKPPAAVSTAGASCARSPRCSARGWSSAAAQANSQRASSRSFQACASPAATPRSPRPRSSAMAAARARRPSRLAWLTSSPTRPSPERRAAQPRA